MSNLIQRLITFYKASYPPSHRVTMSPLWAGITSTYHKSLEDNLASGNVAAVEKILDGFGINGGSQGVDRGPESYYFPNPSITDRSKLTDKDFGIPDFRTGTVTGNENANLSSCASVSMAIYKTHGGVPENVVEIGSALGFPGVIFYRWGSKHYSIIDLPTCAVADAFFLSRCCGEDNIYIYGDPPDDTKFAYIYPSTDPQGVLKRKQDVVFNINSFPEMPHSAQDGYLSLIAQCLAPNGFFLSINHENGVFNQRSVPLAMRNQSLLRCVSREVCKFEGYTGYFQEIYRLSK